MASKKEIQDVWEKGHKIRGENPDVYRKDKYGNVLYRSSYGKNSDMGWVIDHKNPKDKKGTESIKNKQPLQTKENLKKSNKYPYKQKRK